MTILDLLAGIGLVAVAFTLRRSAPLAALALGAGILWFLGDVAGPLVFAHRGPLTHLLLVYPGIRGTRRSRLRTATVATAYLVSTVYPLGQLGASTAAVCVLVVLCVWRNRLHWSIRPRSRRLAAVCAVALWGVLAVGAIVRVLGSPNDQALLAAYEIMIIAIAVALIVDQRYASWSPAMLADVSVDLGERGPRTMQEALGIALGDPALRIGLLSGDRLVDEQGVPVSLAAGAGRVVTPLAEHGRRLGAIEHDAAVRLDPPLQPPLVALIETALANAELQSEVADRIQDVQASRRRLITIADSERRALSGRIEDNVSSRLAKATELICRLDDPADLLSRLDAARRVVDDFGRGVHPRQLAEHGLAAAITELARSSSQPTDVDVAVGRLPSAIENGAYFVVAEALANIAKHSGASRAAVTARVDDHRLIVTISDNGIGGARFRSGGGLAGLRDRLDIAGGALDITSSGTAGTTVHADIPLANPTD